MLNAGSHGSYSGYQRHLQTGEAPCQACKAAKAEYARQYRSALGSSANLQQRAYNAALGALRDTYPSEFDRLYAIERALRGLPAVPGSITKDRTKRRRWGSVVPRTRTEC